MWAKRSIQTQVRNVSLDNMWFTYDVAYGTKSNCAE